MERHQIAPARLALDTTEDEHGLRMVRATTRAVLEAAGLNRDRLDDSLLVVGELAGNVIQHARSAVGQFRLTVECRDEDVLFTITDYGRGFDPAAIPPVGTVRGEGRVGGFGLPLVRTLCHEAEWRPTPAGTTVRAALSLNPPPDESPVPIAFDLTQFDAFDLDELIPIPDGKASGVVIH